MQQLFPEGEFFTLALTGLAEAAAAAGAERTELLDRARSRLSAIDDPRSTAVFRSGMQPEHGAFAAGWSLSLAVAIARASGEQADLQRVREGARELDAALEGAPSPFLASYPGQYWPCDTVVALAALAEASALLPEVSGWRERVINWRVSALRRVDPATGLLSHRVDPAGGRRGSPGVIHLDHPGVLASNCEPAGARARRAAPTRGVGS